MGHDSFKEIRLVSKEKIHIAEPSKSELHN